MLLRIRLSCGELDSSRVVLEQFELLSGKMEQHLASYMCSFFTTIDRVRFWLACGELDRATQWVRELDLIE